MEQLSRSAGYRHQNKRTLAESLNNYPRRDISTKHTTMVLVHTAAGRSGAQDNGQHIPPSVSIPLPPSLAVLDLHEAVLDLHGLVDTEPRPLGAFCGGVEVVLELDRLVPAQHGLQPKPGGWQTREVLCLSSK